MNISENYKLWAENAKCDNDLVKELKEIENDENEIYERFYTELKFGTAGLRGIIGAGTNRMNIYTVRKATQGFANYLNSKYDSVGVAIAYDSRIKADLFAKEAACVLAANGMKVYITSELQPTPVLSFAVRELGCKAGIMVTASHNPAKYNGYKCYGPDGCQMTDKAAGEVYEQIQKTDIFNSVKVCPFDQAVNEGMICEIKNDLYEDYIKKVLEQGIHPEICKNSGLKVVYTPLNGAGNKLVREVLRRIGIEDVSVVKEQENPDGNFPTCPYPNPEFKEALELALKLADEVKPDLVIATDPDSDRVGIAVKAGNEYRLMTGNEIGIMLINYVLSGRKELGNLPKNPVAVKTIVSSEMVTRIAEKCNCELINVLTGFKYIGEQILELERKNQEDRYIFGFEESYGYLVGTYVRDKDAVVASMLISEMAAYYKKQGKILSEVINDLYREFGFYQNTTLNFGFEGSAGMKRMEDIMTSLRKNPLNEIAGMKVLAIDDYEVSISKNILSGKEENIHLPKSNVLVYSLEGKNSAIVRPSGTEPKIKVYVTSVGQDLKHACDLTKKIGDAMTDIMKS